MQTIISIGIYVDQNSRNPISEGITELMKMLGSIEPSLRLETNERSLTLDTSNLTVNTRIEFKIEHPEGDYARNYHCPYCGRWSVRLDADIPRCCEDAQTVWKELYELPASGSIGADRVGNVDASRQNEGSDGGIQNAN